MEITFLSLVIASRSSPLLAGSHRLETRFSPIRRFSFTLHRYPLDLANVALHLNLQLFSFEADGWK